MAGSISFFSPCKVRETIKAIKPDLEKTRLSCSDLKKVLKYINKKAKEINSSLTQKKCYEYRKRNTGLACTIRGIESIPVIIELKRHHGLKDSKDGGVASGGLFRVTVAIDVIGKTFIAAKTLKKNLTLTNRIDYENSLEHWITLPPHPNITPCYGYTTFESQKRFATKLAIYMEYVVGKDLWGYFRDRTFCSQHYQKIVTGVINGVQYLHSNGLVHKDIKLENVLVESATGNVKLCDMDFLLENGFSYKHRDCSGTKEYFDITPSRRILRSSLALFSDDIWSLGILLLEFFICKTPDFCNQIPYHIMDPRARYSSAVKFKDKVSKGGPIGEIVAKSLEQLDKRDTIQDIKEKWNDISLGTWSFEDLSDKLRKAIK